MIKTIANLDQKIDKIFKNSDPNDIIVDIYKLIYPNWENIKCIKGFTHMNKDLYISVFERLRELDIKKHGDQFETLNTVGLSFLWFNKGVGSSEKLNLFEVEIPTIEL
jgi:hypothetical protein